MNVKVLWGVFLGYITLIAAQNNVVVTSCITAATSALFIAWAVGDLEKLIKESKK